MRYRSTSLLAIAFIVIAAVTAMAQTPSLSVAPQISAQPADGWTGQAPPPPPAPPVPPAPAAQATPKVVRESGTATPKVVREPGTPSPALAPQVERRRAGQLVNVKVELTITDQIGAKAPEKKNIVMVVADGERGSIRSNAEIVQKLESLVAGQTNISTSVRQVPLAVDVWPEIEGTKIRLRMSLEYDLVGEALTTAGGRSSIRETIAVITDNGVPLVVALSADPITDRKVALEVKASIMK